MSTPTHTDCQMQSHEQQPQATRRQVLAAGSALTLASASGMAMAQGSAADAYPSKPIRLVIPFQPGGTLDVIGRLLGVQLGQDLGQPIVIDNKPGAAGIIGTHDVVKAAPDGHTVLLSASTSMLINKFLYTKLQFDPARDLSRLYHVTGGGAVLIVPSALPVTTLAELFKYIEANPGKLTYGSYGQGSYPHLVGERMSELTKGQLTHVAYKGEAPMVQAVLANEIAIGWGSGQSIKQHLATGRIRALGITGYERSIALPEIATFPEQGFKDDAYTLTGWFGMAVPAKTPDAIKDKLAKAIAKVLSMPEVRTRFEATGFKPITDSTPQKFEAQYQADLPKWEKLVKHVGVKLD